LFLVVAAAPGACRPSSLPSGAVRRSGGTHAAGSPRSTHGSASPAAAAGWIAHQLGTSKPTARTSGSDIQSAQSTALPSRPWRPSVSCALGSQFF
jgi:hypothetical protein